MEPVFTKLAITNCVALVLLISFPVEGCDERVDLYLSL